MRKGNFLKKFIILPIICLLFMTYGVVNAESVPSTVTIDKNKTTSGASGTSYENWLDYIKYGSGQWDDDIKVPKQYVNVNGSSRAAYCYDRNADPYIVGYVDENFYTLQLTQSSPLSDPGYAYLLQNGTKSHLGVSTDEEAYYVTQVAIWWYKDIISGTNDLPASFKSSISGYTDTKNLYSKIKSFVEEAKSAKAPTTSSTISFTGDSAMSYNEDHSGFSARIIAQIDPSKITDVRISGAVAVTNTDDVLSTSSNIINIKLPLSKIPAKVLTGSITIKVTGNTASSTQTLGYLYKSNASNPLGSKALQHLLVPVTTTATATSTGTKTLSYARTCLNVKKQDASGNSLSGAQLKVTDSSGKTITWTSDGSTKEIYDLAPGQVTIEELSAPSGYNRASSQKATLVAGTCTSVTITNSKTPSKPTEPDEPTPSTIEISKQDATTGKELPGATLEIKDSSGKTVEKWVSTDEKHIVEGLADGVYTLQETIAPDGYVLSSNVTFTIKDGKVDKPVVMKNETTKVKIEKKEKDTDKFLSGAELVIKDSTGKEIYRWRSTDESHTITGLKVGETYTLEEVTAPEGYDKAKSVMFKVKDTTDVQTITMYDELTIVPVPDTGSFTSMMIYGTGAFVLTVGICGTYLYLRKRKSERF